MTPAVVARWRALCLFTLGAFLGLSIVVYVAGLLPGDVLLHQEIREGRETAAFAFAHFVNRGGTWLVLGPATVLLFALSWVARQRWWLWCGLFLASGAAEQAFKFLVGRPRPRGFHPGYPSGHVTAAAAFAFLLVYVASRERLGPARRLGVWMLAVALVLAVGFARVMLNAHWPSDVLGGILLGAGCGAAGAWWDTCHPPRARRETPGDC